MSCLSFLNCDQSSGIYITHNIHLSASDEPGNEGGIGGVGSDSPNSVDFSGYRFCPGQKWRLIDAGGYQPQSRLADNYQDLAGKYTRCVRRIALGVINETGKCVETDEYGEPTATVVSGYTSNKGYVEYVWLQVIPPNIGGAAQWPSCATNLPKDVDELDGYDTAY